MSSSTTGFSPRTKGDAFSPGRNPRASAGKSMRTNSRTPGARFSPQKSTRPQRTIFSMHRPRESMPSRGPRSSGACCRRPRWSPLSPSPAVGASFRSAVRFSRRLPSFAGDGFFRATRIRERGSAMIARTWHGMTAASKADAYLEVLKESGLKEYRDTPGNQGVIVLRRTEGDRTHFLLITFWESFDAIRRFAGPNPERAVYYPEDKEFLLEFEPTVTHYDVLMSPDGSR